LWCALLFVMLCSGCAWLNGDRGSPSANCHEITLANTFMTICNTEYSLTTNNIPFALMLKRSNTPYEFAFNLSVLRVEIARVEFAFTNRVVTMRGADVTGIKKVENFTDGMDFCSGWVGFGIRNDRDHSLSFMFSAAPGRLARPSYVWYCPPNAENAPGPVPFRILECAGVNIRHLSNWYDW
ncbi:MAG: hypothetical protein IKJ89_00410, partial [Kiritimatiellae bacterium]|nr:hypothetical protein [Kiritimatiellia bacterium]